MASSGFESKVPDVQPGVRQRGDVVAPLVGGWRLAVGGDVASVRRVRRGLRAGVGNLGGGDWHG
jgi:hypothetical protein